MLLGISDFSTTNDLYGARRRTLFIVCVCPCVCVCPSKYVSQRVFLQCMRVRVDPLWPFLVSGVFVQWQRDISPQSLFFKTLQIHKHFRGATTPTDSRIPVFWINFTSHHVHIHSYEQAFSLRLSRLYDGIAGIPGAKWTGTATLLNAR